MHSFYTLLVLAFLVQLPVVGDFMRGGEFPFNGIYATLYHKNIVDGVWSYKGEFFCDRAGDCSNKLYNASTTPLVNQICLQPITKDVAYLATIKYGIFISISTLLSLEFLLLVFILVIAECGTMKVVSINGSLTMFLIIFLVDLLILFYTMLLPTPESFLSCGVRLSTFVVILTALNHTYVSYRDDGNDTTPKEDVS
jgi:hypothetical protein